MPHVALPSGMLLSPDQWVVQFDLSDKLGQLENVLSLLSLQLLKQGFHQGYFYNCICYIERLLETITFILGLPWWYSG